MDISIYFVDKYMDRKMNGQINEYRYKNLVDRQMDRQVNRSVIYRNTDRYVDRSIMINHYF